MFIRFVFYGLLGWVTEVVYTGAADLLKGDWSLRGFTFLWMFPIYGLGVLGERVHDSIRQLPWMVRGLIWLGLIWAVEYSSGWLLRELTGTCPWDYGYSVFSIHGFIRLDMAGDWFLAGLAFERVHDWLDRLFFRVYQGTE